MGASGLGLLYDPRELPQQHMEDGCGMNSSHSTFKIVTENVICGKSGVTCSRSIKIHLGPGSRGQEWGCGSRSGDADRALSTCIAFAETVYCQGSVIGLFFLVTLPLKKRLGRSQECRIVVPSKLLSTMPAGSLSSRQLQPERVPIQSQHPSEGSRVQAVTI
ncbi:Mucin-6 [Chelonia mydas]|uniref:Mucin-6 n=1 Tax=Chelonia mydas TaxID=8469 RepID=M7B243_CHEMY|nr:Mucin-6 [Chelonia mydas]